MYGESPFPLSAELLGASEERIMITKQALEYDVLLYRLGNDVDYGALEPSYPKITPNPNPGEKQEFGEPTNAHITFPRILYSEAFTFIKTKAKINIDWSILAVNMPVATILQARLLPGFGTFHGRKKPYQWSSPLASFNMRYDAARPPRRTSPTDKCGLVGFTKHLFEQKSEFDFDIPKYNRQVFSSRRLSKKC